MPPSRLWPDTASIDPRANPARGAIAIYLLELDIPAPTGLLAQYLSYLGPAEGERWRAIRPAERQWQYLQSRVLRRVVLGAYVQRDPAQLTFERDEWRRTRLMGHETLHFSLAQCASHVAMAVGSDAVLGIDVETIVPVRPSFMHIARNHFSAADLDQLLDCPEPRRYSCFLELWTLKQAYLKALGLRTHKPMAHTNFSRTSSGLLVCDDRAPPPERERPTSFLSEKWVNSCQLALSYRAGLPVSFRYLNGNGLAQAWPHTQSGSATWLQAARHALPRPS
jgi:4'-phosphopantetheinyl transferase